MYKTFYHIINYQLVSIALAIIIRVGFIYIRLYVSLCTDMRHTVFTGYKSPVTLPLDAVQFDVFS